MDLLDKTEFRRNFAAATPRGDRLPGVCMLQGEVPNLAGGDAETCIYRARPGFSVIAH